MPIFKKQFIKVAEAKPDFQQLRVEDLKLAPYQRALNKKRIAQYAERYDPDIFGIILVSHRDGSYYIVDGQHRVEVAKLLNFKTVWCQVIEGLTYEQEARKFHEINDRKVRLNANHKFHAKIEARDGTALNILNALNRFGFNYSKEGNEFNDNMITAVGTIQKIHREQGYEGLCLVLRLIKRAWNGDKEAMRSAMLKGLNTFVTNYDFDEDFLVEVLETDMPKSIIDRSKAYTHNIRRIDSGNCFHVSKMIRDMYEDRAIRTRKKNPCSRRESA